MMSSPKKKVHLFHTLKKKVFQHFNFHLYQFVGLYGVKESGSRWEKLDLQRIICWC